MGKIQRDTSIGKILKFSLLLNIVMREYIFYIQIFSEAIKTFFTSMELFLYYIQKNRYIIYNKYYYVNRY